MPSGKVLGIVGCTVLTDELCHVLSDDGDLRSVYIVDSEEGRRMRDRLAGRVAEVILVPVDELRDVKSPDGLVVIVTLNPAGPHDNQTELRSLVKGSAATIAPYCDFCLCFYGLCRNSLWKIDRLGTEAGVPMMILTDQEGQEVDDCFGANLGGKKAYLDAIIHNRGTIFVSPGYAENWQRRQSKKDFIKIIEQVENMRFVFERMGYDTVMKLENGLGDQATFDERVSGFAKIFDMHIASRPCGLGVFEHSYQAAKAALAAKGMDPSPSSGELAH